MPDDAGLIRAYLSGDESALAQLIQHYSPGLYRFIRRLTADETVAQDLTQDVWVKVWKNLRRYDLVRPFKTWLFQIAKNTVFDYYRRHRPEPFSRLAPADGYPGLGHSDDQVADEQPWPDALFEQAEGRRQLLAALAQLTLADQTLISLRHDSELSFVELAEMLAEPLNTVKSRYRRALTRLRQHLAMHQKGT